MAINLVYDFYMLQRLATMIKLLLITAVFITATAPEWPPFQDETHQLQSIVGLQQFDYLVWELNALSSKVKARLSGGQEYLAPPARKELVLDYLARLREVKRLEGEIASVFRDPAISDPDQETRLQQWRVAEEREVLQQFQPLVEAIIEEQVASILVELGFGILGRTWPPVQMHMTPLPSVLVISPRDEIRQKYSFSLIHGLLTPAQEEIETAVYEQLDLSALVVPIGGVGIYPAMIVESTSINFLTDVTAHEWAHHWLTMRPLGLRYAADPHLRTINETVASIVGTEVGEQVIARYYPEYVPDSPPVLVPPIAPADPPKFDFRAEMGATRVVVDRLLAEGKVDAAEMYMEARRREFVANGYNLRRLNQAYFAFYGAYADTPGATGDDPIGPMVQTVRAQSPSLRAFMDRMAPITSLGDLEKLVAAELD